MQDFLAKLQLKSMVSRINFQGHEKIRSQYSTIDTRSFKKNNCVIFGQFLDPIMTLCFKGQPFVALRLIICLPRRSVFMSQVMIHHWPNF